MADEEIVESPVTPGFKPSSLNAEDMAALANEVFKYQPPIDYKRLRDIRNWNLAPDVRAAKAIVSPTGTATGGDFTDIQQAIDYVNGLGGGTVLQKGIIIPASDIVIPSRVSLIGEGVDNSIIDFNGQNYSVKILGTLRSNTGTITVTSESTTVTGVGTQFQTDGVLLDDILYIWGAYYYIASVESETSLTLARPYWGGTSSGNYFEINETPRSIVLSEVSIKDSGGINLNVQSAQGIFFEHIRSEGAVDANLFLAQTLYNIHFRGCDFINGDNDGVRHIDYTGGSIEAGTYKRYLTFLGCNIFGNANDGMKLHFTEHLKIIASNISSNGGRGIYLGGAEGVDLNGNTVEGNVSDGIRAEYLVPGAQQGSSGLSGRIRGNTCLGNGGDDIWVGIADDGALPDGHNSTSLVLSKNQCDTIKVDNRLIT